MKKKFLILTTAIGKGDINTFEKFDNCDYILITDRKTSEEIRNMWDIVSPINFSTIDRYTNRRNSKIYKVLSTILYPEYEYIIWIDSNFKLMVNPQTLIDEYTYNVDLILFNYPGGILDTCVYDELDRIQKSALDDIKNINAQRHFYDYVNMPKNFGLYAMGCFVKKNTPAVKLFEFMWWEQINKFCSRDQCSVSYCIWKLQNELKVSTFKSNIFNNKYFTQ
jgi:hypothetical protein